MKFFQRLWISVTRRTTCTLVLLLFTFLMGNVMAISLSIQQSSENVKNNLMNDIGGKIMLFDNLDSHDKMVGMGSEDSQESLQTYVEVYDRLKKDKSVAYADIHFQMSGLELLDEYKVDGKTLSYYSSESVLYGIEDAQLIDEREGILRLDQGTYFSEKQMQQGENVLIVDNRLMMNDRLVQVGDEIPLLMKIEHYDFEKGEVFTVHEEIISYQVVGTYQVIRNKYSDVNPDTYPFYTSNQNLFNMNEYYCSKEKELLGSIQNGSVLWINSSLIRLKSPERLNMMSLFAQNLVEDTKHMHFTTTADSVQRLIGPVKSFASIAENVLIFSMGAMTIITGLISFYFIRDRKQEIGILMSLGIKKNHLILQVVCETLLVGLLGITLSIGTGTFLSQRYSASLLQSTIQTQNEENDKYLDGYQHLNPNQLNEQDIVSTYEVIIEVKDIQMLYALSGVVLLLSSLFPLGYLLTLRPKNILLE